MFKAATEKRQTNREDWKRMLQKQENERWECERIEGTMIIYSIGTNKWYLSRPPSSYVRIKFVYCRSIIMLERVLLHDAIH